MSPETSVENLRTLVGIPTISRLEPADTEWKYFDEFIAALESTYPLVHEHLEREIVGGHSILLRWRGESSESPTVLMAHYDVVAATDEGWEHPPFAAEITGTGDERIMWGRGTIDDKGSLVAIVEAVDASLRAGIVPRRDIYLSFGHDEETAGTGAAAIADLLASRSVSPGLVLDEGGAIVEKVFPGLSEPTAVIGVSEKGATLLKLVVEQQGGHASTPPPLTATARLARAILRINDKPFPASFNAPALDLFATIARSATGIYRFLFGTLWLTKPILLRFFTTSGPETNAMTRTTQAVTMLEAGHAANALAERASAMVNVRVAVGSSVDESIEHLRRAVRDDAVRIELVQRGEPSPVSPTSGEGWERLLAAVDTTHPGVLCLPYVQNGATDSRHFTALTSHVYRFTPFELSREERDALHAVNERIHVATWLRGIDFYRELIASS